jgi:hypothetical protein
MSAGCSPCAPDRSLVLILRGSKKAALFVPSVVSATSCDDAHAGLTEPGQVTTPEQRLNSTLRAVDKALSRKKLCKCRKVAYTSSAEWGKRMSVEVLPGRGSRFVGFCVPTLTNWAIQVFR